MARDFYGFTYNGTHSSELGILRVSNGSRYEEGLLPALSDKTVQVPGGDGSYFFGSNYTNKTFPIQIAYENVSEQQIRKMRQLFGDRKIHPLIFDEEPYKVYMAKISATPTLEYICFNDYDDNLLGDRTYKGEGSIEFICYYPFAKLRTYNNQYLKWIENYNNTTIPEWVNDSSNLYEWLTTSKLTNQTYASGKLYDVYDSTISGFKLYNPGDIKTGFVLKIPFSNNVINAGYIQLGNEYLYWNKITKNDKDTATQIQINVDNNLIEGIDDNNKITGYIYNKYITKGSFFTIPVNEDMTSDILVLSGGNANPTLEYSYLYF